MPSEGTVREWARENREGFGARYRQARELQLDAWSDLIIDVADNGELDPRDRQARIDARKWIMSKLKPQRWGNRLLMAGDPDLPLQHKHGIDLEAALKNLSPEQLDALEALAAATLAKQQNECS
jgi:hypothetical protein